MSSSRSRRTAAAAAACLAVASGLVGPTAPAAHAGAGGSRFQEGVTGRLGVVATDDVHASRAAVAVLEAGGNAADAAVAAVLTIGVTQPESCGIGGGGFLVARSADGEVRALDFRETAPRKDYEHLRGMELEDTGIETFGTGRGVVGVPGTVAGLAEAHRVLGSGDADAEWKDLVQPAIRAAADGVVLPPSTVAAIQYRSLDISFFPESARTLFPAAARSELGQPATFPDLAATLTRIAEDPRDFYTGEVAETLAAEMARPSIHARAGDRSAMTAADLAAYRPIWRDPVTTTYRGHTVHGMPAPSSGGVAVAEMLNILEGYDLRAFGRSSADTLHVLAEAQKIAWADRAAYLGDPAFVRVPRELTSKRYAQRRRGEISLQQARHDYPALRAAHKAGQTEEGPNTTHLSVLDADGGAVAVTCTIEQALGSAVVVTGGGYLLNNQLTDFTADDPKSPNAPAGGKRPRSSTSPTLVVKGGQVVLGVGGQGGPRIIMGVLQAVVGTVDFGLDPAHALDAARVEARAAWSGPSDSAGSSGPVLTVEDTRIAPAVLTELERRGHRLQRVGEYTDTPGLNAVAADRRSGLNRAAGDPRQARAPRAQAR